MNGSGRERTAAWRAAIAVVAFGACSGPLGADTEFGRLNVSVAVSLRSSVGEAADAFESRNPGIEVLLNSGASGVLVQQARHGAPLDVLISASPEEIDFLVRERVADQRTRRRIATNRLVIVAPAGARAPADLQALTGTEFDWVAVGNPRTAPVGRYARQALGSLGLWDRLRPRLVFAENARHVLDYVARGEVAAGLVYRTDAELLSDRVVAGPDVPQGLHDPVVYEGVRMADSARPSAASAFLDWLVSDPGQAALARYGFLPP